MTKRLASIIHLSDLHFSAVVPGSEESLLDAIDRIDPTMVIVSGDFTLRGARQEFQHAARFLDRITHPVLAVPGNHDISAYRMLERFLFPLRRYREHIAPRTIDRHKDEQLAILGLNTARSWGLHWNWAHGRVSIPQTMEADRFFADTDHAALRCLVVHHPPVVPSDMPRYRPLGRNRYLRPLLRKHKIDLVLSGHLHRAFYAADLQHHTDGDHTTLIVNASTATSPRTRMHANGFNVIELTSDALTLDHWRWEDDGFVSGTPRAFHRTAIGWRPDDPPDRQSIEDDPLQVIYDDAVPAEASSNLP